MRKLNSFSNFQFPVLSFQFFHIAAPSEHTMTEDEDEDESNNTSPHSSFVIRHF